MPADKRPGSAIFELFAGFFLASAMLSAQSPAFEVATIKPGQPPNPAQVMAGKVHIGMKVEAGRVDIGFMSLEELIEKAYAVKSYQVSGPAAIKTERFDILAKMPEGATKEQAPALLKQLLADRFGLKTHTENQEHNVYALVVAKGGPKLKAAGAEDEGEAGAVHIDSKTPGGGATISDGKGSSTKVTMAQGNMHMEVSRADMSTFAEMLTRFVDRPVVDRTELTGKYQIPIDISMEDMMRIARSSGVMAAGPGLAAPADTASDPAGSSVFSGVQALGLKLEPRKETIETVVVDHIEKSPTDN